MSSESIKGIIVKVQRFCIHDGPGIRTTVFLKGCPLRCLWCCNPEGQNPQIELMYDKQKCLPNCNKCILVCKHEAIVKDKRGYLAINREKCVKCMECVRVCPTGALNKVGELRTAEEVVEEALRDYEFYVYSGGGVTLSGGEPLYQPLFSKTVLKILKDNNVHTALDTSGYAPWSSFKEILEHTSLVLYDIKHMFSDKHKELTGVDNNLILENARRCNNLGLPMIIRVPLIPQINDDVENLKALAKFIRTELDHVHQVDILPYHRLGAPKYEMLGREYLLKNITPPSREDIERAVSVLRAFGLDIKIEVVT